MGECLVDIGIHKKHRQKKGREQYFLFLYQRGSIGEQKNEDNNDPLYQEKQRMDLVSEDKQKYKKSGDENGERDDKILVKTQGRAKQAETDQYEDEKKEEYAEMDEKKGNIERKAEKVKAGMENDTHHKFVEYVKDNKRQSHGNKDRGQGYKRCGFFLFR